MDISESGGEGPEGAVAWDNLWDAANFLKKLLRKECDLPVCVLQPWTPFLTASDVELDDALYIADVTATPLPKDLILQLETLLSSFQDEQRGFFTNHNAALRSPINARFIIFDNDIEAASAYSNLPWESKYLIGEFVRDLLVFFKPLSLEEGTRIGSVQLAASHILALTTLIPNASLEYGVVETMLQVVLQPGEEDSMYIQAVLLELCKLAPSMIPPVLAAGRIFTLVTRSPCPQSFILHRLWRALLHLPRLRFVCTS